MPLSGSESINSGMNWASTDVRGCGRALSVWVLLFSLGLNSPVEARNPVLTPPVIVVEVKTWQKNLDELEKRLGLSGQDEHGLAALQKSLDGLRLTIRMTADEAQPEMSLIEDDLAALGKAPAAGEPPESASVVARRQSLNQQLALAKGGIKEAELLINRADRLANQISDLRRSRFTTRLLTHGSSPLSAGVRVAARHQWDQLHERLRRQWQQLASQAGFNDALQRLGWITLLMTTAGGIAAYVVARRTPTDPDSGAVYRGFTPALLWLSGVLGLAAGLALDPFWQQVWGEWQVEAVLIVVVCPLAGVVADWYRSNGRYAIRPLLLAGLALCLGLDWILAKMLMQTEDSAELLLLERFVFAITVSGLLYGLIRPGQGSESGLVTAGWANVRRMAGGSLLLIPLAGLAGYVVLAHVMVIQWLLTVGLYWLTRELLAFNSAVMERIFAVDSAPGRHLRQILTLNDEGGELLQFWSHELVRLAIFITAGVGFLLLWGAGSGEMATWLYKIFFGFRIGDLSFSLAGLLWAAFLLIGLLTVTRLLQRMLDTRIFPKTRWDSGIRHSIRSALGYLGVILAVVSAMSSLGLDLSSLAIIAGALSVGIGFGMQNIVNNFISGLILLVERPIKVGDWVVVGEHQGYVRQISVRATEITTFDRASVFIPNSSLISGTVMNRTRNSKVGRILLPLRVPCGVDAKRLRTLLLEITEAHPEVRRKPAPFVVLRGFGENTLNFELFAFITDVDNILLVTSDLCFEIDALFRAEGIRTPGLQHDVKLTLDPEQAAILQPRWATDERPG